ncbi:hypothetical protein [Glycomyces algeriensis]|uniref:hypothetical protein n=1 Tax=Glycomyces algeriensis TaxID=256037 RepID=UPI0022D19A8C|nr:hypothetical protein [Glycomyces algeriensis]MDA1365525.1 hypothetical protein [Glycomyces algeriensis]MDR7351211.1 hypothetical protein [Glycomyces algeriensis]
MTIVDCASERVNDFRKSIGTFQGNFLATDEHQSCSRANPNENLRNPPLCTASRRISESESFGNYQHASPCRYAGRRSVAAATGTCGEALKTDHKWVNIDQSWALEVS